MARGREPEKLKQTYDPNHEAEASLCWEAHLSEKVGVSAPELSPDAASFLVTLRLESTIALLGPPNK